MGCEEVGLVDGDTSTTGLDEETVVSEEEGVEDELQPASMNSKPVNNH